MGVRITRQLYIAVLANGLGALSLGDIARLRVHLPQLAMARWGRA